MFGKRFLAAAAVVLIGLLAGYWHFAELLARPDNGAETARTASSEGTAPDAPAEPAPQAEAAREPAAAGGQPGQGGNEASEAAPEASEQAASDETSPEAGEASTDAVSEQAGADAATPSFDILRVEPDGDAVIAGRAEPGSEVSLMSDGQALARERANAAGEFVIALAEPLGVGEHQLTLNAAGEGGKAQSRQTAVVSVPKGGEENQLLVLLEEPDRATEVLESPKTATDAAQVADLARPTAGVPAPIEAIAPAPTRAPAPAPQASETSQVAALEPEAAVEPAVPDGPAEPAPVIAGSPLAIGAVEIEDDRLFIAGTAPAGSRIRLYLDGEFLGETEGGDEREFLASLRATVPVGPHVVRADALGRDGTVTSRVEVPFDRPAGTSMAAVAAPPSSAASEGSSATSQPVAEAERPAPEAPEPAVEMAAAAPEGPTPSEASDAVPSEASPAAPAPEAAPSAPAPSAADAPAETAGRAPALDAGGSPAATHRPVPAPAGEATRMASAPSPDAAPQGIAPTPSPDEPSSSEASPTGGEDVAAVVQQPALQPVEGRVIIRRGDTLWAISRDTYGRGSRYTVIYLANGDQIRDPDLIYPGQIFRMPDDAE